MAPLARPPTSSGDSVTESVRMEELGLKTTRWNNSKEMLTQVDTAETESPLDMEGVGKEKVVARMEEIALQALHTDDDPTLNPWTVRMFVLGKLKLSGELTICCLLSCLMHK